MFKKLSFAVAALLGLASSNDHINKTADPGPVPKVPAYTQYLIDLWNSRTALVASDAFQDLEYIANENGWRVEKHQVVTEDGYVLNVYRIPGKLGEQNEDMSGKAPVFFGHALDTDMMEYVMNDADVAPAFVAASQGYDVWLNNNRGTRWSSDHLTLKNDSAEYWNFEWEQMGTKDTTASIDYVLKTTGFDQVTYVGHSQGTTQIMAAGALMPEYFNKKIKLAVLLAPPASLKHCSQSLIQFAAQKPTRDFLVGLSSTLKMYNWLPYNFFNSKLAQPFCQALDGKICDLILSISMDSDTSVDNTDRYDVYVSNLPAGAPMRSFLHYAQLVAMKEQGFQRLDFEDDQANLDHYGQTTPPQYELSNLKFPLALIYGDLDKLADPQDVEWLITQLDPDYLKFSHEYHLGHASMIIAKDMSFFTVDAMALINHYNDKCDRSTLNSKFTEGNEKCREYFEKLDAEKVEAQEESENAKENFVM